MTINQDIEKKIAKAIEYAQQGDIRHMTQAYFELKRLGREHKIKIKEEKIKEIGYLAYSTAAKNEKKEAEEFKKKRLEWFKKASEYLEEKYKHKAELINNASGAELEALIGSMQ